MSCQDREITRYCTHLFHQSFNNFGYVLLQTNDKPTVKCIEFKFVVTSTCSKGILGRGCKIYLKMMLVKSGMQR